MRITLGNPVAALIALVYGLSTPIALLALWIADRWKSMVWENLWAGPALSLVVVLITWSIERMDPNRETRK